MNTPDKYHLDFNCTPADVMLSSYSRGPKAGSQRCHVQYIYVYSTEVCPCCIWSMLSNLINADLPHNHGLLSQRLPLCSVSGHHVNREGLWLPPAFWERPLSYDKQDFLLFQASVFPFPSSIGDLYNPHLHFCNRNWTLGSRRIEITLPFTF